MLQIHKNLNTHETKTTLTHPPMKQELIKQLNKAEIYSEEWFRLLRLISSIEKSKSTQSEYLKFSEWVATQITLEKLEYDFSQGIWFYEPMGEIRQFTTDGLYQVYLIENKRKNP